MMRALYSGPTSAYKYEVEHHGERLCFVFLKLEDCVNYYNDIKRSVQCRLISLGGRNIIEF